MSRVRYYGENMSGTSNYLLFFFGRREMRFFEVEVLNGISYWTPENL